MYPSAVFMASNRVSRQTKDRHLNPLSLLLLLTVALIVVVEGAAAVVVEEGRLGWPVVCVSGSTGGRLVVVVAVGLPNTWVPNTISR